MYNVTSSEYDCGGRQFIITNRICLFLSYFPLCNDATMKFVIGMRRID